jgi:two-component system sensor histidine kinase DctS
MGSVLDITERKQARERARHQEERLAASARLVAMGEMASALAHELNQPLAAIAGYTTGALNLLGERDPATPPGVAQALRKAAEQAQRAGQIIRRVHEFVRQREPARGAVRLNAMVDEAIGFAEAEAHLRGVRISVVHAPGEPVLQGDQLLLQQVLLNLLRNGMDAMEVTPPEARRLEVAVASGGATATVTVADRGCGLAAPVRERMFQPFFTTKPGGMGLGLHICRSVMETHGGRIWAEANPEGGTLFAFSLPLGDG